MDTVCKMNSQTSGVFGDPCFQHTRCFHFKPAAKHWPTVGPVGVCFSGATQSSASLRTPSMHLCGVLSPQWRFSRCGDKYHTHTHRHIQLAAEHNSSQSHVQVPVRSASLSLGSPALRKCSYRTWRLLGEERWDYISSPHRYMSSTPAQTPSLSSISVHRPLTRVCKISDHAWRLEGW